MAAGFGDVAVWTFYLVDRSRRNRSVIGLFLYTDVS